MGVPDRLILRDEQWERMSRHIIGNERRRGSSGRDNKDVRRSSALGSSTKIYMAVRGSGCPVALCLSAGQAGGAPQAEGLISGQKAGFVPADTAYDAAHVRAVIADMGAVAVIPNHPSPALRHASDKTLYKERHLIDAAFQN